MYNSLNSLPYANYVRIAPGTSPTDEVHTTIHSTQTTYKTVTLVRSTKSLHAPPYPTPISPEPEESTTTVHSTSTVYLTKTRTSTRSRHSTRPGPASITGYLSVTIPTELVPHSTENWHTVETSVPGHTWTDGTYTSWGPTKTSDYDIPTMLPSKSLGDITISTSTKLGPTVTSDYDISNTLTDGTHTFWEPTTSLHESTVSSGYDFPTMSPSMVDGTTSGIFYSLSAASSRHIHSYTHSHGTTYVDPTIPVDSSTFIKPTWYFPTTSSAASSKHIHSSTRVHSSTHVHSLTHAHSTSYAVPTFSNITSTASDAVPTSFGSSSTESGYAVPSFSNTTSTASVAVPTSFGTTSTEYGYAVPTFSKRAVEGKAASDKEASVTVASFAALSFTLLAAALAV